MSEETYSDWKLTVPTTRRLMCLGIHGPTMFAETDCEGLRLVLCGDSDGDNWIAVQATTRAEFHRVTAAISAGELPWPRLRFGTWARYHATVTWIRAVIDLLGWTLTAEEQALMDELEAYGQRAPARLRAADE